MKRFFKISSFILLTLIMLDGCKSEKSTVVERTINLNGFSTTIIAETNNVENADQIISESLKEIERINQKYSSYIEGNSLFDLNSAEGEEIKVDEETYELLQKCDNLVEVTGGTFDPALGRIVDLIGFETDHPALPEDSNIKNLMNVSGWNNVKLLTNNSIYKKHSLTFNFSALVKGYAVDKAAFILDEAGFTTYLINADGEVYGKGKDWNVGIRHPRKEKKLLSKIIINGMGMATSEDYEHFFEKDGKRFTHIINPSSGYPADKCQSVTVIASNAVTADALATGVFVTGSSDGIELIEKLPNTEGMIVDNSGRVFQSSGFEKYLRR